MGLGGGETSLLGLLGAIDRKRIQPVVICPGEGQLTSSLRELGIDAHVLTYRGASLWFVPTLWERFAVVRRFEALLRELSPQIVHSDFHALAFAMPASRRLGIPLIFTCYGGWFQPRPWQRAFYRDGPSAILAISESVRQDFLGERPFMAADRVRVLHLGVDGSVFRPRPADRDGLRREFGLPLDGNVVTLLARFQAVKGHDVFLTAAGEIARRHPDSRFVLAGENVFGRAEDESFKRRVMGQARADPFLRDRVTFLGWVPNPERLLAASDILICSSRYESFGMALVEAMACGLPVVSTWAGGPAEVVRDGETGYLVPPKRPDLLAARVIGLLQDEGLRRRMGSAGRADARERFDVRRYANGFSAVVESVAARPATSGG